MKTRFVAYYSIIVGISVLFLWIGILKHQQLPEHKTELTFHLIAEFLMAFLCIISGIMLLRGAVIARSINLLGLGMVIYSFVNAAGYYGQQSVVPMVLMFLGLFLLTCVAVVVNLRM